MKFLDRTEELARLRRFLSLKEGALACLYGRRRIGKSRLLEELLKGWNHVISHVADKSEAALQRARLAKDISSVLPGFGDVQYADWGVLLDRWQRDAPAGSVLIIDELPYLVEQSPELPSVLQRIVDRVRTSGQKIFLSGSSQRMMLGMLMDASEPLYGRARELINLGPIAFPWTEQAFPGLSVQERFKRYAVLGGVPRYWEICQDEPDFNVFLRQQVFSPHGLLHDEPSFVLQTDLQDSVQASSVLSLIGQGVSRTSEIAARLQCPATALGRPLKRLMSMGLVCRDIPFGTLEKASKRTSYRLSDPFLRFWYLFAQPNYSDPYFFSTADDVAAMAPAFRVFLGQAWETLVREGVAVRPIPGVAERWRKVARWWGTGLDRLPMELDVVAESVDGTTLLVGEVKLSVKPSEIQRMKMELQSKVVRLPFGGNYKRIVTRIFAAQGGSGCDEVVSLDWLASRA